VTSDPDPFNDGESSDIWADKGVARRQDREGSEAADDAAGPVPADVTTSRRKPKRVKSSRRNALEWVAVVVGAVLIAVLVRTFLFQTFWIPSPSMSPTLVKDDRVIVNKLSYKVHAVHRGDVVVFRRPPNEPGNIDDLIKRVVGLPGERVLILDGKVRINGRALAEPYTHGEPTDEICSTASGQRLYGKRQATDGSVEVVDDGSVALTVPKDHVFVMGDKRTDSTDSRCFGPIDENLIVGRAFVIMWPPGKAGGL